MSPNLSSALLLMLVGMITVFLILGIVVVGGQVLIRLTNRFSPLTNLEPSDNRSNVNKRDIAIITAVVAEVSQGKASKINIEKL